MKDRKNKFASSACLILFLSIAANAQTGGIFTITQSVVASGGGQNATGGAFSLGGTIGQPIAGTNSADGTFTVRSGFWQAFFAPTAAGVSISGCVLVGNSGLRNAFVMLTDTAGNVRTVRTSVFGYYRFDDIEAGQTVVLSVVSKRFQFAPQVVSVNDDLTELNFTAQE
jgi:hypothetical protein